jgi:alkylation response protein AidB-like acyl-CoA dehydrogenase
MTTTEQAPAAETSAPAATFSLELNDEQRQLQEWVHGFAEKVIRPAAHEWDEREETPWPIIKQAAEVGIYGPQFLAHLTTDPTGLMVPIAVEEIFWGDAGIGMAILGTSLAVTAMVRRLGVEDARRLRPGEGRMGAERAEDVD